MDDPTADRAGLAGVAHAQRSRAIRGPGEVTVAGGNAGVCRLAPPTAG